MIIKKIIIGFVVQSFDTDTGKFTNQEFIAGDEVTFENENGDILDPSELPLPEHTFPNLPLEMVQPTSDETVHVLSSDGKCIGMLTGETRECELEGCSGEECEVRWETGEVTWVCRKGFKAISETLWQILD